ncbi:MAG: ABC transporter permease subunit, partial [Pseudomonadota bacterium]
MNYRFQFGVVWPDFDALLQGALLTFQLGVAAFMGGAAIGLTLAALKTYGPRPVRFLVDTYVVLITNTPALIQIYILYYGLPEFKIRWSGDVCVLIGLTLNA